MLVLVGTIVIGTTVPGEQNSDIGHSLSNTLDRVSPGGLSPNDLNSGQESLQSEIRWTKIAHFFLFALLGYWGGKKQRGRLCTFVTAVGMLICGTEFAQLFIKGRGATLQTQF